MADQSVSASEKTLPIVTCPGCGIAMVPKRQQQAPAGQVAITYVCEKCGTDTTRTFRVD
jgi:predicted RNA-binding Zn-ribbon protein involved in translation (DUF1610 family)